MKLSKTSWIMLIGGILFILFASLGIAGAKQLSERGQLSDELDIAENRVGKMQLDQLNIEQAQLVEELDKAMAESEAARENLKLSNESIDVTDFLFEIASSCSVTVIDVNSSGLSSGDLEGISCTVQQVGTTVEGNLPDLISFITRLNTEFTIGVVDSAQISIVGAAEDEERPTASIQLSIYNYQGD